MSTSILLITPPFTQLNTPYPATAYLKGFLESKNIRNFQIDMGIEVILKIFSKLGLKALFQSIIPSDIKSENGQRIFELKDHYIQTIDLVIQFLQGKNPSLAHLICSGNFLPEASRYQQMVDLDLNFGQLGIYDKAKYLCTLFVEDLGDFIYENIDDQFGFSRYAEKIASSAATFDHLHQQLQENETPITKIIEELTLEYIQIHRPQLIALSIPFPGNLYAGLVIAKTIKSNFPEIAIAMGGGYVNTELRNVSDTRLFEYIDFLTYDDGELPILQLWQYLNEIVNKNHLVRTTLLIQNRIEHYNNRLYKDFKQAQLPAPNYNDLKLKDYISVLEMANPMHRLWTDGQWNKLTLAHGCYWGKCTFCDISLDYIGNYEAGNAKILVDKIEDIINQTQHNNFHFVDEAAPPALMRDMAIELINRKLKITWWTNIRFEKNFSSDLCKLLAASGCIAVTGGLEVASDRLLILMEKGVNVQQVAQVARNFTESGIMVHAYLMYGFPTQNIQETVDALEVVRQLFELNLVTSAFWHQFSMTAHSPIGINPEKYKVAAINPSLNKFANNDIPHIDLIENNHVKFSEGLRKSLYNYMHGICFDYPLQEWFDFKIPNTTIAPYYIAQSLKEGEKPIQAHAKVIWLGNIKKGKIIKKKIKGVYYENQALTISNHYSEIKLELPLLDGEFIEQHLTSIKDLNTLTLYSSLLKKYEESTGKRAHELVNSPYFITLREFGLLFV